MAAYVVNDYPGHSPNVCFEPNCQRSVQRIFQGYSNAPTRFHLPRHMIGFCDEHAAMYPAVDGEVCDVLWKEFTPDELVLLEIYES